MDEIGLACTRNGESRGIYKVLLGNPNGKDHFQDSSIDGQIILRWSLRIGILGHGLDRSGSGWGQVVGTCDCGNEPSGSINSGEFLA